MTTILRPLNIWFNRSFATSYWLIKMLRENPDNIPVNIFATHKDPTSPVLQAADHHGHESELIGQEYVTWCIDYCLANAIDVFIPRNNIEVIAQHLDQFEAIGVKVLASSYETINVLADKNKTYLAAQKLGIAVPPWRVANTEQSIREGIVSLQDEIGRDERIVIKPTVGVGAQGFRILSNEAYTIDDLLSTEAAKVTLIDLLQAYRAADEAGTPGPELMLLPFLESPEISADCLADGDGNFIKYVPRTKDSDRLTRFSDRYPAALDTIHKLHDAFDLRYLTNTQLRWWKGEAVLLETNTRASGGLYSSTLTGVNLIWEAVSLALGNKPNPTVPELDKAYISLGTFTEVTTGL
jgi:biotin carboxylase